jgi:hypothetical protein
LERKAMKMEHTANLPRASGTSEPTTAHTVRSTKEVLPAAVEIGLSAAIITVQEDQPEILIVRGTQDPRMPDNVQPSWPSLPFGHFTPRDHRTLNSGLRSWVNEQTGLALNYVEQLYTFADRGRQVSKDDVGPHVVSIGYLALLRPSETAEETDAACWRSWYDFFPWEDWRDGKPQILSDIIEPSLKEWAERSDAEPRDASAANRKEQLHIAFGMDGGSWDEEKALERFELLYEAGLVAEALRDGRDAANQWPALPTLGQPLSFDHRRILATSISRIRAKIKYRPVVFELMPDEFTLFELQKTVEAILGPHLHKQNFRRLVESAGLVETTGEVRVKTGGRPARLYQFRRKVLLERPAPGVRVNLSRG